MIITRKAYNVRFGEVENNTEYEGDTKTVMAETGERAIEIAKSLLSKSELKRYFVEEVELLVDGFDAD